MIVDTMLKLFLLRLLSAYLQGAAAKSTLFEHGTVITFDEQTQSNEILYDTSVLVTDNTITAIFRTSEADSVDVPSDAERIPAEDLILSPGFIDAHRHNWQSTFRTMFANITLAEYIPRYGSYSQGPSLFTPEDFYLSDLVGTWEALNAGVTSMLDHSHGVISPETAEATFNAYVDSGARVFWGFCLDDSYDRFPLRDRMANYRQWASDPRLLESRIKLGVSFDSWGAIDLETLQETVDFVKSENIAVLTSHWVGGVWGSYNSPTFFLRLGLLNESFPIVFSHGNFIAPEEYQLLRTYNHHIATTPEAEMHLGMTSPVADRGLDQVALGVDTHATFSGDLVGQARLLLQSTRSKIFTQVLQQWKVPTDNGMSVNQAFILATRGGAQALRRPDLGVIQIGATADIVAFNGISPNMVGWSDPIAAIILHSNVGDVVHVMVDGDLVKKDGKLVAENLAEVTRSFAQSAKKLQLLLVQQDWPGLGDAFPLSGFPYGTTEKVDVVKGEGTGY